MMFGASVGYAQDGQMYVTGEGDSMMVMGGEMAEGARVVGDDTFAVPSDCPEGAYYRSGPDQLTACGEGGASFDLSPPAPGTMMSSGEAYPEGTMMMAPHTSGSTPDSAGGTDTEGANE